MFRSQRILGSIISGIGGLAVLFALLRLPYITKIDFTNTSLVPPTTLPGTLLTTQVAMGSSWQAVLIELLAVILVACIGWQMFRSRTAKDARMLQTTIPLIFLSSLILVVSLTLYSSSSATLVSHTFIGNPANNSPPFTCASDTSSIASGNSNALSITTVVGCIEAALSIDYGPGFWLYVVGMILVLVGSLEQIRIFRTASGIKPG